MNQIPPSLARLQPLSPDAPLIEHARSLARAGLPILPCDPSPEKRVSKRPLLPAESIPGARDGGLHQASADEATVDAWWRRSPGALIGLRTGSLTGTVVVDLDPRTVDTDTMLQELLAFCGVTIRCPTSRTQSGGLHLWFAYPEGVDVGNRADLFRSVRSGTGPAHVDVRGDGGYVIVPPSVMKNGRRYTWEVTPDVALPPLPPRLLDLIVGRGEFARSGRRAAAVALHGEVATPRARAQESYALGALRAEVGLVSSTAEGSRGSILNAAAFKLGSLVGAGALSREAVLRGLLNAAETNRLVEKDGLERVERCIERGLLAGLAQPRDLSEVVDLNTRRRERNRQLAMPVGPGGAKPARRPPVPQVAPAPTGVTEDSVALTYAEMHAADLRYCHSRGRWYIWSGTHWRQDSTRRALEWCRRLARESAAQDEDERTRIGRYAFATGVEKLSTLDERLAVDAGFWDADPFLLGTPGGTVDLRAGDLRPADPREGISRTTAVEPAEFVDCPRWLAFLDEATGGDQALIRFLQQWSGYNLTGSTKEHALVFVHGNGGNGKSLFVNTIAAILGDYATTAPMDMLMAQRSSQHPTDLASLAGARMVTAQETEEGRAWAESRIKIMTGGDKISARFMRQDFFEFLPFFKLTIVGNHEPVLRNVDEAMRRRFNVIPFVRKPEKVDRDLAESLREEWPGILRWMIEGCLHWQEHGLVRPEVVAERTNAYFDDQDSLAHWLQEKCEVEVGNSYKRASAGELFASWSAFALASNDEPGSKKSLSAALQKRGFEPYRTANERGFMGIRLKPTMGRFGDD